MRNTLGFVAGASMIAGPVLAWLRLVPGIVGFGLMVLGGIVGLIVGVGSLVALVRGRRAGAGGVVAMVAGALVVLLAVRSAGVPRINDFTTDLADPPAFHHAGTLPANAGRDLAYPVEFVEIERACCVDLHPARVPAGPEEAFGRAHRVAASMPAWEITQEDPAAGTIEAIATTPLFGFHDDIVIRVRPDGDRSSHVDIRSKSRVGKGDIGTNAARIRAFVAAVEGSR
jgi:uncharacterized protein (DUF1499 family)